MRIRSIHPDALKSRKLRVASAEAERCYWRLLVACDDQGRCEDDVDVLSDQLFLGWHLDPDEVEEWLWELHGLGLIIRYATAGLSLLEVTKWSDYQHPQHPKKSTLAPFERGTERSHEGSPGHGEVNGGELELSREELEKLSARTFVKELPQEPVDEEQQRVESGAAWRAACRDAMQARTREHREPLELQMHA